MLKKCKVVMLPTNKKAPIVLNNNNHNKFRNYLGLSDDIAVTGKYQHLYILSDDKINEGDSYICYTPNGDMKAHPSPATLKELYIIFNHKLKTHKIIATSDKSLNLPLISQAFIEKYCEFNGNIDDVNVRFEKLITDYIDVNTPVKNNALWTNSNREISIKPYVEETFTKEDFSNSHNDLIDEILYNILPTYLKDMSFDSVEEKLLKLKK